jgi:hypothetical protein
VFRGQSSVVEDANRMSICVDIAESTGLSEIATLSGREKSTDSSFRNTQELGS